MLSATPIGRVRRLKKLLQKIKYFFSSRKKKNEIARYIGSIERDEKGRWVFPDKVGDTPEELLSSRDWIEVKKVLGDKKTWDTPCMCDMVIGKCVC